MPPVRLARKAVGKSSKTGVGPSGPKVSQIARSQPRVAPTSVPWSRITSSGVMSASTRPSATTSCRPPASSIRRRAEWIAFSRRPEPSQAATSASVRSGTETSSPAFCTTKAPEVSSMIRSTWAVIPRFFGLRFRISRCGPR